MSEMLSFLTCEIHFVRTYFMTLCELPFIDNALFNFPKDNSVDEKV